MRANAQMARRREPARRKLFNSLSHFWLVLIGPTTVAPCPVGSRSVS